MRIALFGATGHTGRLVIPALQERGVDVLACARRSDALEALRKEHPDVATQVIDVKDATSVRAALRADVDGLANLAGPFLETGFMPLEAAIRQGIPYVDTTGEQAFMHEARRRYHSRAVEERVAVVHALAYEYALADLAVRARFPEGGDALHVLYRNRGAGGSAGTKKSIVRVMAAPSLGYEKGRLVRIPHGKHTRTFQTEEGARDGMSIPGGEALTVPRHTPFETVRTYFVARPSTRTTTRILAPVARLALRGPVLRAVERRIDRQHETPDNAKARGEVHVVVERGGATRAVIVRTGDPYLTTAQTCAEGIVRLAKARAQRGRGDVPGAVGVLAPAEAFDAADFLDALAKRMDDFSVRTP